MTSNKYDVIIFIIIYEKQCYFFSYKIKIILDSANSIQCKRHEIFEALSQQFHLDLSEKIEVLETRLATNKNRPFTFHQGERNSLKNIINTLKAKWVQSNRTRDRFLAKNVEWLDGTTTFKVGFTTHKTSRIGMGRMKNGEIDVGNIQMIRILQTPKFI